MHRAATTRERLIDAAAEILETRGLRHLNTNALAATAGVTPPTVYRNFSNKEEVVVCLARRFIAAEETWLAEADAMFKGAGTPAESAALAIDRYWESAHRERGIVALRSAMRVWPELREVEEESLQNSTAIIARALAPQLRGITGARLHRIARYTVECVCSTIDRCYPLPPAEQAWRIEELKRAVAAYLNSQLTRDPP